MIHFAESPTTLLLVLVLSSVAWAAGCAMAGGETPEPLPRLTLEPNKSFACQGVEGELIVLVHREWGAIAVAPESFPEAEPIGRIDDGGIHLSIPGLRMPELQLAGHCDAPGRRILWGRRVAPRGLSGKPGCGAIDRPEAPKELDERVQALTERILAGAP